MNLRKVLTYACNVTQMRNSNRYSLFPGNDIKHAVFIFSDATVIHPTGNQQYFFKLFIVKNKAFRQVRRLSLSALQTGYDSDLQTMPQLSVISESILRGTECFIQWNITPYVRQHNRLPQALAVTYTGSAIEFWPHDSMYLFFAPRIETLEAERQQKNNRSQAELLAILSGKNYRGVIIYPPTIDWNVPLFQRPQQLMKSFAKQGYICFYVTANHRYDDYPDGFTRISDNLYLAYTSMDTFSVLSDPIVILSWAMNISYLQTLGNYFLIYDYIDDISIFNLYDQRMEAAHRYLLRNADVAVATASRLLQKAKKLRQDIVLCPNGVDFKLFSGAKKLPAAPRELNEILAKGKQIVGYYGALAEWVDYSLIRYLAEKRPHLHIVLIGMDYDGSLSRSEVDRLENVSFLGHRSYTRLPNYLAYFDVAIIPFCINEITLGTNPIKMYEYMCAGKPVVTTNMPECVKVKCVLVGKNKKRFVKMIDKALKLQKDKAYVQSLVDFARENTWDNRVRVLKRIIEMKRKKLTK